MPRPTQERLVPLDKLKEEDDLVFSVALRWLIGNAGGSHTLSAAQQVASRIGSQIVRGALPQGAPLLEKDLSEALEVSRGPIREALRILEREGLVQILARKGARVTQLSMEEVTDLFEIRATLFAKLAHKVAQSSDKTLVVEMEGHLPALRLEVGAGGNADRYAVAAFRMALTLASASPNPRLREMLVSFSLQTLRYSTLGFSVARRRRESLQMWQQLISLFRNRKADEARALVEHHVQDSCRTVIAVMGQLEADGLTRPLKSRPQVPLGMLLN